MRLFRQPSIRQYLDKRNYYMCFIVVKYAILSHFWWPCKFGGCAGKLHRADTVYWPHTAYCWDGKGKDPNGPWLVCKEAAEEMTAHWDEMWREYYSGRL